MQLLFQKMPACDFYRKVIKSVFYAHFSKYHINICFQFGPTSFRKRFLRFHIRILSAGVCVPGGTRGPTDITLLDLKIKRSIKLLGHNFYIEF
jgi:hypothetical protein